MTLFTEGELAYLLDSGRLARLATVGVDGMPHVTPVGWSLHVEDGTIEVGGLALARTKKFRDIRRTGQAAIVVDDVPSPWKPRGIEIRGRAEALDGPPPVIRIHPVRIVSWGIESEAMDARHARTVG